jgi:hypothetical protein
MVLQAKRRPEHWALMECTGWQKLRPKLRQKVSQEGES